jgi:hypothetical protein
VAPSQISKGFCFFFSKMNAFLSCGALSDGAILATVTWALLRFAGVAAEEERRSFLKKRTKKLLSFGACAAN